MLRPMLIDPSSLEGRCTFFTLTRQKLQHGLEFLIEIWPLLKNFSKEPFVRIKFNI